MIIAKHLDGDFKPVQEEFNTVKEALEYDYTIWRCLGENCSFYYKGIEIGTDNHSTIDENILILEAQMRYIDSLQCK